MYSASFSPAFNQHIQGSDPADPVLKGAGIPLIAGAKDNSISFLQTAVDGP
jgi:hypothetical protein